MELCGPAVPDLSPGSGVGAGAPVLQLAANGSLPAHHEEDNSWAAAGELGASQPRHDHALWALPVSLSRVLAPHAVMMTPKRTRSGQFALERSLEFTNEHVHVHMGTGRHKN